jgi:hypothetical protein
MRVTLKNDVAWKKLSDQLNLKKSENENYAIIYLMHYVHSHWLY